MLSKLPRLKRSARASTSFCVGPPVHGIRVEQSPRSMRTENLTSGHCFLSNVRELAAATFGAYSSLWSARLSPEKAASSTNLALAASNSRSARVLASAASRSVCSARSRASVTSRSEQHTSELQSRGHLVCRLLLEEKN